MRGLTMHSRDFRKLSAGGARGAFPKILEVNGWKPLKLSPPPRNPETRLLPAASRLPRRLVNITYIIRTMR